MHIKQMEKAFYFLFSEILDKHFSKSIPFEVYGEKEFKIITRFFLLGYFLNINPEFTGEEPPVKRRPDFMIGDTALEFAVRTPLDPPSKLKAKNLEPDILKLTTYQGESVLVLYDFSDKYLEEKDLEEYSEWANEQNLKYPFTILYFHKENQNKIKFIKKLIRAK